MAGIRPAIMPRSDEQRGEGSTGQFVAPGAGPLPSRMVDLCSAELRI